MIIPECDSTKPLPSKVKLLVVLLSLLFLGAGIFVAVRFIKTRPTPPQRPLVVIAPLVETTTVTAGPQTAVVQALGTVVPARQTLIRSEVAGVVREISPAFVPGGTVVGGSPLLRLADEDFRLAVTSREAELENAKAALELELGYQQVARHEWELLGITGNAGESPDLALRKPQLAQARAKVRQAEAALDQARLDLKRTTVTAPFTALVLEKNVEIGSRVSITDTLATLVDTREFWVEAAIPVDRLPWITLPGKDGPGSAVRIRSQASGAERTGRILRLRGDLEEQGRLARVQVSLPAPLEAPPAPILLGEYVRLEIEGTRLENVIRLPRAALRENDTVWTVHNATLAIRPATVAWRDTDTVLVSDGLESGDTVVTSELASPIDGMPVSLGQEK
ncbi:RND family efflux transporter, MFP subunit [Desulfomicrobium norvegicum]|uniref:RND family efflux transporter, MFP subunit n=1 Tax=Desulfomicrobium norvegicum (strain DSM 1741 / NCIMB 8310) TaxID=52561 RepID=A0A8G2F6S4_DESNO|nr:efflux RND transporter periplasmic adaptor subunit [Desulfomicrobium norvegicum]SFL32111.1 RND family efflux transporter, MFP subunit [Desulfomicrobium norvegicum]